jgi:hypothetical protein
METLAVCLALFKTVVAVDTSVQIAHEHEQEEVTTEILHCDWGGFKREQGQAGSSRCNKVQGGVLHAVEVKHLIVDI